MNDQTLLKHVTERFRSEILSVNKVIREFRCGYGQATRVLATLGHLEVPVRTWHGCYRKNWRHLIVDEAFRHPAKFSCSLVERIIEHGFQQGYWAKGDLIGDPFGGVGCGAILATFAGLRWIGEELEPKFLELGQRNFALHASKWKTLGYPAPILFRGDSRQFDVHVRAVLTSPPYADSVNSQSHGLDFTKCKKDYPGRIMHEERVRSRSAAHEDFKYGDEPGQIGALGGGSVDAAITSPPWNEKMHEGGARNDRPGNLVRTWSEQHGRDPDGNSRKQIYDGAYGSEPEQIGTLKTGSVDAAITSPLYAESLRGVKRNGCDPDASDRKCGPNSQQASREGYGDDPAQLERLPAGTVDGAISSPPFLDARSGTTNSTPAPTGPLAERKHTTQAGIGYGGESGQIDQLPPGTVDGALTSPPYADGCQGQGTDLHPERAQGTHIEAFRGGYADAAVTSPPWEDNCEGGKRAGKLADPLAANRGHGASDEAVLAQAERDAQKTYGEEPGQIGKLRKETYWEAMRDVYAACFRSIRPGGVMAIVVKDFVKDKKRVPLCDDTLRLLTFVGFQPIERVHAMLVETEEHAGLFGPVTKTKSRKSFFRRVNEQRGSPAINFEEVLFVRRP